LPEVGDVGDFHALGAHLTPKLRLEPEVNGARTRRIPDRLKQLQLVDYSSASVAIGDEVRPVRFLMRDKNTAWRAIFLVSIAAEHAKMLFYNII